MSEVNPLEPAPPDQPIAADKPEGEIAHRLPGRIRVRIPRLRWDQAYAETLRHSVAALAGVTEVRLNPAASSIIISYQVKQLSEQLLLDQLSAYAMLTTAADALAADAASQAQAALTLTQKALALRLRVSSQTLTAQRIKPDFADWSKAKDPEAVAWSYRTDTKSYLALPSSPSPSTEKAADSHHSSEHQGHLQEELRKTVGEHYGEMVGQTIGEGIGTVLLGSSGAALTAELGAAVGEVVGGEFGAAVQAAPHQLHQSHPANSFPSLRQTAEHLGAEIVGLGAGEAVGEVVGGVIGTVLLGPAGLVIGAEFGAVLGAEVGEAVEADLEKALEKQHHAAPASNSVPDPEATPPASEQSCHAAPLRTSVDAAKDAAKPSTHSPKFL
jgi:hypothetical protein